MHIDTRLALFDLLHAGVLQLDVLVQTAFGAVGFSTLLHRALKMPVDVHSFSPVSLLFVCHQVAHKLVFGEGLQEISNKLRLRSRDLRFLVRTLTLLKGGGLELLHQEIGVVHLRFQHCTTTKVSGILITMNFSL